MKSKTNVTIILLAFVAISIGFVVYKEVRKAPATESVAVADVRAGDDKAAGDMASNSQQGSGTVAQDKPVADNGPNSDYQKAGGTTGNSRVEAGKEAGKAAGAPTARDTAVTGAEKDNSPEPKSASVGKDKRKMENTKPAEADVKAAAQPKPDSEPKQPAKPARKFIAYYFKTTNGCASCTYVENFTREALDGGFPDELNAGSLSYQVINLDFSENKHFIQDYQLSYKSVVLVEFEGEKQTRWKNLEAVWRLLRNKPEFIKYVQDETKAYLEGH